MSNVSIRPIDRSLHGATSPGQNWPGSDDNEEVLFIPQSASITQASPSGDLMSYLLIWKVLPLYRDAVGVFFYSSRLGFLRIMVNVNSLWECQISFLSKLYLSNIQSKCYFAWLKILEIYWCSTVTYDCYISVAQPSSVGGGT